MFDWSRSEFLQPYTRKSISLTCAFRNLEDKSSLHREVSISCAVNCNIRRLFACDWVSLDSSDFLFLSSETHFSTLEMTKNQRPFRLKSSVKFLPLYETLNAKSPQALTGVVSSNTYERFPFSDTPSHRNSDISAHDNENKKGPKNEF